MLLFIIKPVCFNRAEISVCVVKTLKYAIAWSEVFQAEFVGCAWRDNRDSAMCTHCRLRIKALVSRDADSVMYTLQAQNQGYSVKGCSMGECCQKHIGCIVNLTL